MVLCLGCTTQELASLVLAHSFLFARGMFADVFTCRLRVPHSRATTEQYVTTCHCALSKHHAGVLPTMCTMKGKQHQCLSVGIHQQALEQLSFPRVVCYASVLCTVHLLPQSAAAPHDNGRIVSALASCPSVAVAWGTHQPVGNDECK